MSPATAAWYEQIKVDGDAVFNGVNPRGGSGDTKTFPSIVISNGSTSTIEYNKFRDSPSGGGAPFVDMSGTAFTITFSDGSVVNFSV
jgi:hypothetical protein